MWHRVGVALTHRNFRLVWLAALGSTIGTWMQQYAEGLLVFRLTGSKFYLALDTALGQAPILLFMLIGGVIADRYDRRRLLTGSQLVQAFAAFSLTLLVFTDHITIWHILFFSFLAGCGQAFGGPAYQSLIPSLVPREHLPNAIALNSTQFNLSRVLGPTIGSAVLIFVGTAACFGLNGLSFFLVVFTLAALHLPPAPPKPTDGHRPIREDLAIGLTYVKTTGAVLALVIVAATASFLAQPLITMLPAVAAGDFRWGPALPETRLAILQACQGAGAIIGALTIGGAGRFNGMGRTLILLQVAMGLLIVAFTFSHLWPLTCLLMMTIGMTFMAMFSISFSSIQLAVPDKIRGRVISIYMVALRSGGPLGGLVTGAAADIFTTQHALLVNGALLTTFSTVVFFSRRGRALREF
jgi:MFS family permease